jgi:hypothetical protein
MNNTQTAIEWLREKIKETYDKEGKLPLGYVLNLLSQAKAVEAEQIIEAYRSGRVDQQSDRKDRAYNTMADEYYQETYKTK